MVFSSDQKLSLLKYDLPSINNNLGVLNNFSPFPWMWMRCLMQKQSQIKPVTNDIL